MSSRLQTAIAESEAIYMAKAKELAYIQFRFGSNPVSLKLVPQVTEASIKEWLGKVVHNPAGRHRRLRNYATAYYTKQLIIYNPLFVEQASENDLLDTVLHELGHLFTWYFIRHHGHGIQWRMTGSVVGYAEVGGTTHARRVRYASYAAHKGTVEAPEAPLGRISSEAPANNSTVSRPVNLVWQVCEKYPHATRAQIISFLVARGVNPNTAKTQYYHWKKAHRGPSW